jgi:hypothetical protein
MRIGRAVSWAVSGVLAVASAAAEARAEDRPTVLEVERSASVATRGAERTTWRAVRADAAETLLVPAQAWGSAAPAACCPKRWRVNVTLAAWTPGFQGDVILEGNPYRLDITPVDVIENMGDILSAAELMIAGGVEVAYCDWWVRFSGYGISLGEEIQLQAEPGALVPATQEVTLAIAQAMLGHKVFERTYGCGPCPNRLRADVGAGARMHVVDASVTAAGAAALDTSETWIDPIVGGRLRYSIRDRWYLEAEGDVGGFGLVSDFTWRARLSVGWRPLRWLEVSAGWIWLDTDYDTGTGPTRFQWDVLMHGPYVALGFNF